MESTLENSEIPHFRVALICRDHMVADLLKNALSDRFVQNEDIVIHAGLSGLVQSCTNSCHLSSNSVLFVIYVMESVDSLSVEQISALAKIRLIPNRCFTVALVQKLTSSSFDRFNAIGFDGLIPASFNVNQLRCIIELIKNGSIFYPLEFTRQSELGALELKIKPAVEFALKEMSVGVSSLTRRQEEVMHLIVKGMPNKEIARELQLSHSTVKVHVADIMRKLDAANRTHAVAKYASLMAAI